MRVMEFRGELCALKFYIISFCSSNIRNAGKIVFGVWPIREK
jgi:hypothetical protein